MEKKHNFFARFECIIFHDFAITNPSCDRGVTVLNSDQSSSNNFCKRVYIKSDFKSWKNNSEVGRLLEGREGIHDGILNAFCRKK